MVEKQILMKLQMENNNKQGYVTIPLDEYERLTDKIKNFEVKAAHVIDFKYNIEINIYKDAKYFSTLRIAKSHYVDERHNLKQILEDILKLAINLKLGQELGNNKRYIERLEGYCEEYRTEISKLETTIKNYKEEIETMKNTKSKWWYKLFYKK
jgi:hypothetical protein